MLPCYVSPLWVKVTYVAILCQSSLYKGDMCCHVMSVHFGERRHMLPCYVSPLCIRVTCVAMLCQSTLDKGDICCHVMSVISL